MFLWWELYVLIQSQAVAELLNEKYVGGWNFLIDIPSTGINK